MTYSDSLKNLITQVQTALAANDEKMAIEAIHDKVCTAIKETDLLTADHKTGNPKGYARHIVHSQAKPPYTILALVWEPGQASPIHGHQAWCVVGIIQGNLTIESYIDEGKGSLTKENSTLAHAGESCIELPEEGDIHRISNQGTETAISLHIYGCDLIDDPLSINDTYEPALWQGAGI